MKVMNTARKMFLQSEVQLEFGLSGLETRWTGFRNMD
jgi:hypothetical protein